MSVFDGFAILYHTAHSDHLCAALDAMGQGTDRLSGGLGRQRTQGGQIFADAD
ncbi:hypothetical protein D3C80_2008840 [compost metagenome]